MSFSYNPMPEDEAVKAKSNLLEDGIYKFELYKDGEYSTSPKGNPVVKLMLRVKTTDGDHVVFDNLIGTKNWEFKTRHFCYATGLHKEYEAKTFSEKLCEQGLSGEVEIGHEPEKPNPNGGVYRAKNIVIDYVKVDVTENTKVDDFKDCEIPF